MKILITGASGYIGSHILENIKSRYKIKIISRNVNDKTKNNSIIFIDSDQEKFKEKVQKFNPDVTLHLAAYSTSSRSSVDIEKLVNSNILFGIKILDAISETSCKYFISTGTFAEYSEGYTKIDNAYLYSATKTSFRNFVDYYKRLRNFIHINVTPFTIYGGETRTKKVIDYLFESFYNEKPINMTLGKQKLDFIHINDVIEFYKKLLFLIENNKIKEDLELFLGTGKNISLRNIAFLMKKKLNKKININWGKIKYRELDILNAKAPIEMNPKWFKWKAKIDIEKGLDLYLEAKNEIKNIRS